METSKFTFLSKKNALFVQANQTVTILKTQELFSFGSGKSGP
jgi:hypothetical protein